ncbi:hypothetical protein KIW84_054740 [Lathyrus oleraceus]|uniref:Uncharacterized protein n=1 Tax=Pisum sativum TaxID=3888 RepID=A0A9D4WWM6_PEA|nr:hypothetical protein KIW84_054740 [Pisum sativum]
MSNKKIVISRDVIVDEFRQFDSRKSAISAQEIDLPQDEIDFMQENQHSEAAGTGSAEIEIDLPQGEIDFMQENLNSQPAEGTVQQPFVTETGESSRRPTRQRGLPQRLRPPQYKQQPYFRQHVPHQQHQHARQRPRKPERHIDPLPMPYNQVFSYLIKSGLIVSKELNPVLRPYSPGFDANSRCDFYVGAQRHSTKDCKVLKIQVQTLLGSKMFSFTPQVLQINYTPSPSHAGPSGHTMKEITQNRFENDHHTGLNEDDNLQL